MNVEIDKRVYKDTDKLPLYAQALAKEQIIKLLRAKGLSDISNVRHMEGTDEPFYRLKFGSYRFMMYYDTETNMVTILSLTHRKDTYKKHNLPWRN